MSTVDRGKPMPGSLPSFHVFVILALLWGLGVSPSFAVDGVIEINQARAAAGGVSTGDGAGFPVTLSEPGSYRLTGNLAVSDTDSNAIEITGDNISLDLNGFEIAGPGSGSGSGVRAVNPAIYSTVVGGTVHSFGFHGLDLRGFSRVLGLRVHSNGLDGIRVGINSLVSESQSNLNGDVGIRAEFDSKIASCTSRSNSRGLVGENHMGFFNNVVRNNSSHGIEFSNGSNLQQNVSSDNGGDGFRESGVGGSILIGNTAFRNNGFQLTLGSETGFVNNVLSEPFGSFISGGVQLGVNLCGGSVCP